MTPDELIAEGRLLQRHCTLLRPVGHGAVAARWYGRGAGAARRRWIAIDTTVLVHDVDSSGRCLSVFIDDRGCEDGDIAFSNAWPEEQGLPLYAHAAAVLPPVDAVFARGSAAVAEWIRAHDWDRNIPYSDGFGGRDVVRKYERLWQQEHPLYLGGDVFAVLGGWHFPWGDDDWHDLIDDQLLCMTLRDAEPWVEVWRQRNDELLIKQRIT